MHSIIRRSALAALAFAGGLVVASPCFAETVTMKSEMKASSGGKGTGSATVTFDTASKKVSWKGSYKDLTGPATAAHFHTADGGVAVPISPNDSPFEGSATLTDAQAAELMGGKIYINIHTAKNPAGEIRGQVTK